MVKKSLLVIGFLLVLLLVLVTYNLIYSNNHLVNSYLLNSEELESLINSGDELFLLNVHTPYYGEIPKTDVVIEDWENLELYANVLPIDKSAKIVAYCRSGSMSSVAANTLRSMGYSNVYELDGGMNSWVSGGRKLEVKS